jgi:glycosyltransferase involved in cell wall biosynthesis
LLAELRAIEEIQLEKLKKEASAQKIRLLFVNFCLVAGGLEKTIYYILKYLDRNIFIPELVTYYGGKWENVMNQLCPVHKTTNIENVLEYNFKVIHLFTGKDIYKFHDRAKIIETIEGIGPYFIQDIYKLNLYRIIYCSEMMKNFYTPFLNIDVPRQVQVIYNPCEIKEVDVKRDNNLIGWVGRISPEKNYKLFLKAAELLPEYKFVIIGEAYKPELNIEFLKLLEDTRADIEWIRDVPPEEMHEILARMGLLCITSFTEGLPLSMLEAMAVKTPVLSTCVGGIPEIIKHRQTGFLSFNIRPEDYQGYAEDIKLAMAEKDNVIDKAYATVLLKCNIKDYIRKMEILYLKAYLGYS